MKYVIKRHEKKAKLVGIANSPKLWLQNMRDEWIHDVYEESDIHYGKIYSVNEAFHYLSTSVTGFFQDEDTKKWIYVKDGVANKISSENMPYGWEEDLQQLMVKEIQSNRQ